MASDRIKGITIEINGDATKLTDALKGVNKEIKNTQSELRDINKLLKIDPGNTDLLKQKQEALSKAIGDTEEKLRKEKEALEQLKNAPETEQTRKQQEALTNEITKTETELKGLKKEFKDFGSVAQQQLKLAGDKMQDIGKNMQTTGKDLTMKVTAPVVGLGAAAVKTSADYESALSNVKALTGATADEMQRLKDNGLEMSKSTKFTASEVADAYSYMALAGWDASEMIAGLPGILYLASAGNSDLATTSDIVTDGLTAFGLSAQDAAKFADILAVTMSKSNTTTEMLGEAFKYVGPLAGSMGYSIEDVATALGTMANSGIKASQGGTALRRVILNLTKPSDAVANVMDDLGISLFDADENARPLMDVLNDLRSTLVSGSGDTEAFKQGMNELSDSLENGTISEEEFEEMASELAKETGVITEKMSAFNMATLAGAVGMSGLASIVGASDEDWNSLSTAIGEAEGAAKQMADTQLDNLNGQLTILKSSTEALGISIGDLIVPVLKPIVDGIQSVVDKLNQLDPTVKGIIVVISAIVAAIGPVLIIVGKIIESVGIIVASMGPVVTIIGKLGALITGTLIPAITSAGAAILASPITWIVAGIAAVVAAIVLLIKHWDDVKAKFIEVKDAFLNSELFQKFKEKWSEMKNKVGEAVENMKTAAVEKFNSMKQKVSESMDNIKKSIEEKINKAKDAVHNAVEKIKSFFKFEWKLPDIKLPHFSIEGSFSLNPPSVPKLGVSWYKKAYDDAYILNSPTIFGASGGRLLGGGEGNGSEAIVGTEKLMSMISEVVGGGTTIIPVYIGSERIDEIVVNATNRNNFRSGGR